MRSARPLVAVACLAGSLALIVGAPPTLAGSAGQPGFRVVRIPGTSGFSEPRVTVIPDGMRYVDTNASKGGIGPVYGSRDGRTWTATPTVPAGQTVATTDVDIVSTHTGRLIASELDDAGINFITSY